MLRMRMLHWLVTPAGPKASSGGAANGGPTAQWVAVQHPAKRQKPSAAAAVAAAAARAGQQRGEEGEGDEERGGAAGGTDADAASGAFSPSKAAGARWNSEVLAHNAAVKADGQAMQGQRWAFLEEQLAVLRPFITPEVAAKIRGGAAEAKAAGLPPLPPPVEVQPGAGWPGGWSGGGAGWRMLMCFADVLLVLLQPSGMPLLQAACCPACLCLALPALPPQAA